MADDRSSPPSTASTAPDPHALADQVEREMVAKMDPGLRELFGEPISIYSRARALADGELIDVTERARELGFKWPTALTHGVWSQCVAVPPGLEGIQDESGRLHDVLWMASIAARRPTGDPHSRRFEVYVLAPRPSSRRGYAHDVMTLHLVAGPGDLGEPVLTIVRPEED